MWQLALLLAAAVGLGACGTATYGAATDGRFPSRPAGADYPNWEHICAAFSEKTATRVLNEASDNGWELVAVGVQGSDALMCFKRPKQGGR